MFTYRPSAGEAETGRSPGFGGQPTLPGELRASERHGLKNRSEQLLQNNFMAPLSLYAVQVPSPGKNVIHKGGVSHLN